MTKIVHCKKEKFDVYIGRPSIWGNPFSHKIGTKAQFQVSSREEAVSKYKEYLLNNPHLLKKLPELKNKTLGCWCKPLACHGDIIIEVLNQLYPD
jgi:hypothetical protein